MIDHKMLADRIRRVQYSMKKSANGICGNNALGDIIIFRIMTSRAAMLCEMWGFGHHLRGANSTLDNSHYASNSHFTMILDIWIRELERPYNGMA